MLPIFHSTPCRMRNDQPEQQWAWRWCLLAALVVHLLVAAIVLPSSLVTPLKEEQAITVELVQSAGPQAQAKAETPPPAPPKPQTGGPTPPSSPKDAGAQPPPPAALEPVFQFGDKDRGPQKSTGGNGSERGPASPSTRTDPAKQNIPRTLAVTTAATDQVPQATSTKTPAPTAGDATAAQQGLQLHEAKTLFSQAPTNDLSSMMAIGTVPRGDRAAQLCSTELGEQLVHASPGYYPDSLPLFRLKEGTVLDVPKGAFHSNSQWYALSYRCEVDPQATKVVSFAFHIGQPIPRSDWSSLGLPSQ
ncbi:hypothetical protein LMIY3S_02970 [Labrys miyagiensis]